MKHDACSHSLTIRDGTITLAQRKERIQDGYSNLLIQFGPVLSKPRMIANKVTYCCEFKIVEGDDLAIGIISKAFDDDTLSNTVHTKLQEISCRGQGVFIGYKFAGVRLFAKYKDGRGGD